ncbi:preprotein translocase subunit SecG [bacterium]|nr:preprotein translocase subunit SecG [bacterium]
MYFDLCLRAWSLLGQTPAAPAVNTTVTNSAATAPAAAGGITWLAVVRYILMVLYLLVCIGLIVIVLNKNTKSDGLTGLTGAGGANQSSYHGKKSYEENLSMASNYLAVSFIVLSMVISLVMH